MRKGLSLVVCVLSVALMVVNFALLHNKTYIELDEAARKRWY